MNMCVVYLLQDGSKAKKQGGRLVVENRDGAAGSVPLQCVTGVVVGSAAQLSTQAVFALLEQGVALSYIDFYGRVKGQLAPTGADAAAMRAQAACLGNERYCKTLAKELVQEKIAAQHRLLSYYSKKYIASILTDTVSELKVMEKQASWGGGIDRLRGLEGTAARLYFNAFGYLVKKLGWTWGGRSRRPAQDGANTLLNYGYAFLERDVRVAMAGAGLDARNGFLHSNNDRKDSLVYDLMEKYRADITERFNLKLMHLRIISEDELVSTHEGWRISDEARKTYCQCYEAYMEEPTKEHDGKSRRALLRAGIERFADRLGDVLLEAS